MGADDRPLPVEHLGRRRGERAVLDVPSPHPERGAQTRRRSGRRATRSASATVPASTTVVTPLVRASTADSEAASSSSSGWWAPCSGTDHSKIESPGGNRSGMQLRTSGSPVRCWWASIMPGVTTHVAASSTAASGYCGRSSVVEPTATITSSSTTIGTADEHLAPVVHGDDVAAADHPLHRVMLSDPARVITGARRGLLEPTEHVDDQIGAVLCAVPEPGCGSRAERGERRGRAVLVRFPSVLDADVTTGPRVRGGADPTGRVADHRGVLGERRRVRRHADRAPT